MSAPLPVLGEKHRQLIEAMVGDFTNDPLIWDAVTEDTLLRDIEAHVRALVEGEVVEVSRNVAIHLREAHADWLTPQTQEKP